MSIEIVALTGPAFTAYRAEIVAVYAEVFSGPPYNERPYAIREYGLRLPEHTASEGFRGVVANDGGRIVGFAYGFASRPGQWWHDVVRPALREDAAERWLGDAFEMAQLAVLPDVRGRGVGGSLHDLLLQRLPQRTAVASTVPGDTSAMRLYRRRGWVVVLPQLRFPTVEPNYSLIGLELSASAVRRS